VDHISEHDLVLFAFDPAAAPRRSEIETHIAACASCRTTVDFMRVTDADLGDEDVWEQTEGSATMDSLLAMAAQIAAEDAEADELLKSLLQAPAVTAWTKIQNIKRYRTGGVVRRLNAHAFSIFESEPLDALTFADAAISVAEALPDDLYPGHAVNELRGTAWIQRANALRLLGRFDAALDALTHAERAYRRLTSWALGLATVAFVRATVLNEQQRPDEAATMAAHAERTFAHLGDDERRMRALFLRAYITFEQHHLVEATTLFEQVLAHGEAINDAVWIARACQALGNCFLDRQNIGEASIHFHRSLALFAELGITSERVRTEWGIARMLLAVGKHADAVRRLRHVTAAFEDVGMVTDAALAGLDVADGLLVLERTHEIIEFAAHLFRVFTDAGMLTGALTAIAYIKEAAAAGTLTPTHLDAVRRFLRRAERQPELLFVPPPQHSS
jgi:tetratricopeptide (TPR) repeat protein